MYPKNRRSGTTQKGAWQRLWEGSVYTNLSEVIEEKISLLWQHINLIGMRFEPWQDTIKFEDKYFTTLQEDGNWVKIRYKRINSIHFFHYTNYLKVPGQRKYLSWMILHHSKGKLEIPYKYARYDTELARRYLTKKGVPNRVSINDQRITGFKDAN